MSPVSPHGILDTLGITIHHTPHTAQLCRVVRQVGTCFYIAFNASIPLVLHKRQKPFFAGEALYLFTKVLCTTGHCFYLKVAFSNFHVRG